LGGKPDVKLIKGFLGQPIVNSLLFTLCFIMVLKYSAQELNKSGKALTGSLHWNPENEDAVKKVFAIAHDWRMSHAGPMSHLRSSVDYWRRTAELNGMTVSRLKRMSSIRKKLTRTTLRLSQIQDLGGCRSILSTMDEVISLAECFESKTSHDLLKEFDYIKRPKDSGYRSLHRIYLCQDRKVEIQFRTRIQHSWATAVEVVGTFLQQDMKASEGNQDWLRLFKLVSAEFALAEKMRMPAGVPSRKKRREQIRRLSDKLDAISTLESIRYAFSSTDYLNTSPMYRPKYYLIEYNNITKEVNVRGYNDTATGGIGYLKHEQHDQNDPNSEMNIVLVEADKIETVKEAFPNYFGDVKLFCNQLNKITGGEAAVEYTLPPIKHNIPRKTELPDDSWLTQPHRRKWN